MSNCRAFPDFSISPPRDFNVRRNDASAHPRSNSQFLKARLFITVGGLRWDDATFAEMTRRSVALAEKYCQGRLLSVLEGGYNPAGLASEALAHVKALV